MHWSSSLERRFIPKDARIIGDLHCPGCSYPLHGLEALGRCPECGRPVLDSIRPIPEPAALARALSESGWAFLTLLLIVFASLFFGPIVAGVGIMLLAVLAGFRAFASAALARTLRSIAVHGCGDASRRLLIAVALEFVPIVALLILTVTDAMGPPNALVAAMTNLTPLALMLVALVQIGLLADLGRRIGRWLDLQRTESEANLALRTLAVGAFAWVITVVMHLGVAQVAGVLGFLTFGLIAASLILVTRAMWRAAAAVPQLDQSPATLIDRPMMSVMELKEHGLLPPPRPVAKRT